MAKAGEPRSGQSEIRQSIRVPPLITLTLAVIVTGVVLGGWFLWSELASVRADLAVVQEDLAAAEAELGVVSNETASALTDLQGVNSNMSSLASELRGHIDSTYLSIVNIGTDLDLLASDVEERFIGLGRCLYHEAEFHTYNYWYLEDQGSRYITECD